MGAPLLKSSSLVSMFALDGEVKAHVGPITSAAEVSASVKGLKPRLEQSDDGGWKLVAREVKTVCSLKRG